MINANSKKKLFALIARNAFRARAYYGLPSYQVIEIGVQVSI
ncbi:MAG: hypothetical protein RI826_06800 [Chlorobium phaeovibrioides]|nr:hypothetical protein [Chlorobium phaeovibrioides]